MKMHATPDHNTAPSSGSSEDENAPASEDERDNGIDNSAVGQVAPGQTVTHYAPDIPCYLLSRIQPSTSSSSSSDATAVPENTYLFHMTPNKSRQRLSSSTLVNNMHLGRVRSSPTGTCPSLSMPTKPLATSSTSCGGLRCKPEPNMY